MFLVEAWLASAVIACTTLGCWCFSMGYSSAPEWLEPVLWPRTGFCELLWETTTSISLSFIWYKVFLSSRVTGACPVTTDLIMRVNVRTTTRTTTKYSQQLHSFTEQNPPKKMKQNKETAICNNTTFIVYPSSCCTICCCHINSHNQVRGHRTGSSHSGAEDIHPCEGTYRT